MVPAGTGGSGTGGAVGAGTGGPPDQEAAPSDQEPAALRCSTVNDQISLAVPTDGGAPPGCPAL